MTRTPSEPDPTEDHERRIRAVLEGVRRHRGRLRFLAVLRSGAWVCLLLVALGTLLLGLVPSVWLRLVLWSGWLASTATLFAVHLLAPTMRERPDRAVAALLERHNHELRDDLTSSIEFSHLLGKNQPDELVRVGSVDLMRALIAQTAQTLNAKGASLARALPRPRVPSLAKVGVVALLLATVFSLFWPDLALVGLRRLVWLDQPLAAASSPASDANRDPLVASLVVTYRYPGYTRRPTFRENNPTGHIETLAGTEITIEAVALRRARRAALVLRSGSSPEDAVQTEIGMSIHQNGIEVTFSPLSSGSYQFVLEDLRGNRLTDPVVRTIDVVEDQAPSVQLIQPDAVVEAAPTDVIPFQFTLSDDYGLTEIAFVHSFSQNTDREVRDTLATLEETLAYQDAAGFDLQPLALQPSDEILVMLEAVDNDTVQGPKAGRSRPVLIHITSPDDRHQALIAREAQLFEDFIDVLGDYLENPLVPATTGASPPSSERPATDSSAVLSRFTAAVRIHGKVADLVSRMQGLFDAFEGDELMLQRDYELLLSIHRQIQGLLLREQDILSSMSGAASRGSLGPAHLERIQQLVRIEQVQETERSILTLEELLESQRMESLQRTLDELRQLQEQLRGLLEEYQRTRDPELRAQIERELARLEARMRELLQRLAEQMENLPQEHYNLQALRDMGMMTDVSQLTDALERVRSMLDAGNIEDALSALDDLEMQIQALEAQVAGSQASGGGDISEMDRRMNELIDEINDLEAQQSQIERDTSGLQERIRQRRIAELERELSRFVDEARQDVEEMRRLLAEMDRELLSSEIDQSLEQADGNLEILDRRLAEERIESALQALEQAREQMAEASFELRHELRMNRAETPRTQGLRQAHESVQQVGEIAQDLAERLEGLLDQAQPTPGSEDWEQLLELARSQGMTSDELAELIERVAAMGEELPLVSEQLGPPLDQVANFMEGAQRQLSRGQLPGALEDEQAALQRLRQLRQSMHQMVAQDRMGRRQQNLRVERVEIPEEPDETPGEFRQDILDAMREESIEAYQEVIRRYYQSLVE